MLRHFQSKAALDVQIREGYHYFLVCHNDLSVGYLSFLANRREGQLFLSKFYVRPSYQGKGGIGGSMMAFVEDQARQHDLRAIWLTANKNNQAAIRGYRRWGFEGGRCR